MLRLHGRVRSRTMRPLWLLEELSADYEYVSVMPRSPEAGAMSPLAKIPILEVDGEVILDSVAQMTFLADRHGAFTHPAGTVARARQDAFSNAVLEMLDAPLWAYAQHSFGLPEEYRVEGVKPTLTWQMETYSAKIADLMDGDFAVGEAPTIADILLAHCAGWARGLKMDLAPPVLEHMRRMRARPAFERALARGEDE
ncbi:glutathione S-transferase family protein [Jannaschia aquimarina]|uniref:Glutathionine S-transferase n=1 Tax=Jannaschia aquimarina TaxID=935700 RepID=A0A0D1DA05_9RHOB|nr:glutathione S-transferase [Jannaschia aquimarina]KIT16723.1 glutathionine S-transferase [Jannaschia aquimarina]SNS54142.1 glutathione S-transferase [Jannaschia aquimarina]